MSGGLSEAMNRVQELDLEPIIFKLTNPEPGKLGLSLEDADRAAELYRKFLSLVLLYPERSIVPTKEIDAVWHAHILDTAKYREDCENLCGGFIDHFPYLGLRGAEDAVRLQDAFDDTRQLFKTTFGVDLLPNSGICSGNECGSQCDGSSFCDRSGMSGESRRFVRPRPNRNSAETALTTSPP